MAQNSYNSRRLVYVIPFGGTTLKYGFLTNVEAAVGTACGHVAVTGDYPTGLVIGANAPKPGRASRQTANSSDSTFYDIGQRAALKADGWALTNPKIRRGSTGKASQAVYVNINGAKYAWRMPESTYLNVGGDLAALGINEATSNDVDLAWGCSYPKPPKAQKTIIGADGVDTLSTFVDPSLADNLPTGWSTSAGEEYLGPAV